MNRISKSIITCSFFLWRCAFVFGANPTDSVSWTELEDFVFEKKQSGTQKITGVENAFRINQAELFKAACCNLGESFVTNPSVDVNYCSVSLIYDINFRV